MPMSTVIQRFILLLVLSAQNQRTEAFVTGGNSLDCLDCVYAPAQHSVIFPIRESDNGNGISLTELEKGDALSSAFDAMVDSCDFMFQSSAESPSTIIGQGIGAALRGLRPITEIQYLDYLLYAVQTLSDDLATLHHRTAGGQKAPLIIRTRGHRLEGVWHSGSPISMILGSLRGINVLVPRDMTQAAGFYNTMLQSDDPALIIECLNGYRLKERMPDNIGSYTVPVGLPEIIREGRDVTLVTYGSCIRPALQGCEYLEKLGISVELIDVQTLLPFELPLQLALNSS